jgi:mRNA interferase HicA
VASWWLLVLLRSATLMLHVQQICCTFALPKRRVMRMKYSEFRRWLKAQGVEFQNGKGSHFKVSLNGKSTVFPDHGAKEMGEGLRKSIIKQLGLKD